MEKLKEEVEQVEAEVVEETTEEVNEIDLLAEEISQLKDKFLRNQAELNNFKRRTNEERIRERKYAQQYLLMKLVDMMDNFERAINHDYKNVTELKDGLKMIMAQLTQILTEERVDKVDALNKEFDPNFHQAVMTGEDPDLDDNVVSEEFQPGYMYKDRILRPSMVKVNKKGE